MEDHKKASTLVKATTAPQLELIRQGRNRREGTTSDPASRMVEGVVPPQSWQHRLCTRHDVGRMRYMACLHLSDAELLGSVVCQGLVHSMALSVYEWLSTVVVFAYQIIMTDEAPRSVYRSTRI